MSGVITLPSNDTMGHEHRLAIVVGVVCSIIILGVIGIMLYLRRLKLRAISTSSASGSPVPGDIESAPTPNTAGNVPLVNIRKSWVERIAPGPIGFRYSQAPKGILPSTVEPESLTLPQPMMPTQSEVEAGLATPRRMGFGSPRFIIAGRGPVQSPLKSSTDHSSDPGFWSTAAASAKRVQFVTSNSVEVPEEDFVPETPLPAKRHSRQLPQIPSDPRLDIVRPDTPAPVEATTSAQQHASIFNNSNPSTPVKTRNLTGNGSRPTSTIRVIGEYPPSPQASHRDETIDGTNDGARPVLKQKSSGNWVAYDYVPSPVKMSLY